MVRNRARRPVKRTPLIVRISLFLATCAGGATAAAQPPAPCAPAGAEFRIEVGSCRTSSLDRGDRTTEDGTPYEDWTLTLQPGQTVQIDMDADPEVVGRENGPEREATPDEAELPAWPAFDTYLEVRRAGREEVVASNDDRPDSLNSRVRFTADEGGDYLVRARPFVSGEGGYSLRIVAVAAPAIARRLDSAATVDLQEGGEESALASMFRMQRYTFGGAAGERIRVTLEPEAGGVPSAAEGAGEAAGAVVAAEIVGENGEVLTQTIGGDGRLQLLAVLPRTEPYLLRLHFPQDAVGRYRLTLARHAATAARRPRPIRVGEELSGEIGLASMLIDDVAGVDSVQVLSEMFVLRVRANQPVTVTLRAEDFDPVLEAGVLSPLGFATALANDDEEGGSSLNSRLVLRPTRNGTVHLRARALGGGGGPFRIAVVRGDVSQAPSDGTARSAE